MIEIPDHLKKGIGPAITDAYILNRLSQYASNKGAVIIKLWSSLGEDIYDMRGGWSHPLAPHWHAWIEYPDGSREKLFFNKHRRVAHGTPRGWQRERTK